MKQATVAIPEEVRSILEASTFTGSSLQLPPTQLERKLYTAVNKVIELAGGKWDKKTKSHVFPGNPRAILGLALETGQIVDRKKTRQAFYTPSGLASRITAEASVHGHRVLEPSAGGGSLVRACLASGAVAVDCIEIDAEEAAKLPSQGNVTVADFLATFPSGPGDLYERIVMNPPFARNQDIKHVSHAATHWLKTGGRLVAIMSSNTARRDFLALADQFQCTWTDNPAGAFKESGTNVATITLTLCK